MKKILLFTIICGIFLIASFVSAKTVDLEDPLKGKTIQEIISTITDLIALIGSGIAVIMIIIGGIQIMIGTSTGEKDKKVAKGKKTITWALIGIAIIWSAKFLVDAIEEVLKKTQ